MREDFVEPMPEIQTKAMLVFGKIRVECFIVDVNVEEFRVAVPGAEFYEGDPRVMLVTRDAVYPVRIVLQEQHAGGYSYRLVRTDDPAASGDTILSRLCLALPILNQLSKWHCVAAGIVGLVGLGIGCLPAGGGPFGLTGLRNLCGNTIAAISHAGAKTDIEGFASASKESVENAKSARHNRLESRLQDSSNDVQTVSVSLIAPASMSISTPALLPDHTEGVEQEEGTPSAQSANSRKRKPPSLKALLEEGQVGRMRDASPSLAPWLFRSDRSNDYSLLRLSDAACSDLKRFQIGLKGLSRESSTEAIVSLRQSLRLASNLNNSHTVRGTEDMFVIRSDDANVYYTMHNGMVELIRILPID